MYVVNSPRVGIVGEPFNPDGHDVAYLLAGGFIVEKSHTKPAKSAKTEAEENPEEYTPWQLVPISQIQTCFLALLTCQTSAQACNLTKPLRL
jgi:hypothetical protein